MYRLWSFLRRPWRIKWIFRLNFSGVKIVRENGRGNKATPERTAQGNERSWAKASSNNAIVNGRFPLLFFLSHLPIHSYRALFTPSKTQRLPFPIFHSLSQRHRSAFLPLPLPLSTSLRHWNWHVYALLLHYSLCYHCCICENPNSLYCCAAGPKNWLKDQKKKASKYLLAPIDASRQILRSAYLTLSTSFSLFSR